MDGMWEIGGIKVTLGGEVGWDGMGLWMDVRKRVVVQDGLN